MASLTDVQQTRPTAPPSPIKSSGFKAGRGVVAVLKQVKNARPRPLPQRARGRVPTLSCLPVAPLTPLPFHIDMEYIFPGVRAYRA